ncbi:MAG: Tryptophan synthase alpha chain [Elusimicrobia bacterium ADurb.Bin231]|nr:MAG: Tryptophan synthase alpha chain [Elusimicrobia bacterium ADurb.Bin231]
MNKLQKLLVESKSLNRKLLSIFLTAGFPNPQTFDKVLLDTAAYADIIELGVPFSDPVADGPTIQYSSQKAIEKGVSLHDVLSMLKNFRKKSSVPVVIMSYSNPVYRYGVERFFREASSAGLDGIILPDVPYEERCPYISAARKYEISYIPIVSLTTSLNRAVDISGTSTGFVYVTAVTGVTGVRKSVSRTLPCFLKDLKSRSNKPIFVGFGISSREHIIGLKNFCDGFIVGSAVIEVIRRGKNISKFLENLRSGL